MQAEILKRIQEKEAELQDLPKALEVYQVREILESCFCATVKAVTVLLRRPYNITLLL